LNLALNLANLTNEQQIGPADDYRIDVRRGVAKEATPKRMSRKMKRADEQEDGP
jgi:hypothetical protein